MPKLFELKFPAGCNTLPEGFWSAVDVWINKPHVINKRICGVRATDSRDVDTEELLLLLNQAELPADVLSFLTCRASAQTDTHKSWSCTVRTFIPKVNCYGKTLHKDVILRGMSRTEDFHQALIHYVAVKFLSS